MVMHPLSEALIHLGTVLTGNTGGAMIDAQEMPMSREDILNHVRQAYTIIQTEMLREYAMHKHNEDAE